MTRDQERGFSIAEEALARIRAAGVAPDPMAFEIWFTYGSGDHPALNREVDALTARGGVSADAVLDLYNRHLSPNRHLQRLFVVGESLRDETRIVANLVDTAFGTANGYGAELNTVARQLDQLSDAEAVSRTVAALIQSTEDVKRTNSLLQTQLKQSESQVRQLQESIEVLRLESMTDPLTGVANRKLFDYSFKQMVDRADQTGAPLSLMIADIDRFKEFNDQFGHQVGDDVLRLVAFALKSNVRNGDLIARYGGDEFAILLPRTTLGEGVAVGEKVRRVVMAKELVRRSTREAMGRITLSIGVAEHAKGESPEETIGKADGCLYAAKHNGRNQVSAGLSGAA